MTKTIARLPAPARHLTLAILTVLLTWAGSDVIPALQGQTGGAALVAGLLAAGLAVLTPLVNSYGVGKITS